MVQATKFNVNSWHPAITSSSIGKLIKTAKKPPPLLISHVQSVAEEIQI